MRGTQYLAVAVALGALAACAPQTEAPAAPTREALIARGDYLVHALAVCNDCHTPMTPQGPDMTRQLVGADLSFAPINPQPWAPHAPALAGLPEGYTEAQLATFLQTGERPTGIPTAPPMPPYRMNADDAAAISAYIASMPRPDPAPAAAATTPSAP